MSSLSLSEILDRLPTQLKDLGPASLALGAGIVVFLGYVIKTVNIRRKMPPGPVGLPLIGNKHQMPPSKPWRKFEQLNKQYGPVVSLFFGSTPIIVCGTAQAAWDLLEKRSDIYSSRPRFIMGGEILSDNLRGLMLPYGEQWRKWRKIVHAGFHLRQATKYKDIQSLESKVMLQQFVETPKNFEKLIKRYAASVVTSVSYGRRVESMDEWIVVENNQSMDFLVNTNIPGKYLVESWPWLLKLPKSLQWFRREAEVQKERDRKLAVHILDDIKQRMQSGTVPECFATEALRNQQKIGMDDLFLAHSISTPFGAGIETTGGTLLTFILAMLHFPDVMKKVQAEIDSLMGSERMPEYDDEESLPYVRATVNEALRWRPVAVLGGTPHAVTADDVYNGMFIPKGSTVFANLAGIMKDPEMFPNPDEFRPERFIETTNPRLIDFELPFGFGRRICPGMHLARNSVFINIARLMWAFDILPALDAEGKPIIPDSNNYTDGFNSLPVSFDCRFVPRNEKVVDTIKSDYELAMTRLASWSW